VISLPYERDPRSLARVIASCDAFVHANDREPFGLIVLEAMACGVPVVGVASGGVAETVDERVGRLARSADPAHFAEAVEALFAGDLGEMGLAARRKAMERFAWNRVFEDIAGLYAGLTGEHAFIDAAAAAPLH
jgi:alpha-1,6-mannosyltransferase